MDSEPIVDLVLHAVGLSLASCIGPIQQARKSCCLDMASMVYDLFQALGGQQRIKYSGRWLLGLMDCLY